MATVELSARAALAVRREAGKPRPPGPGRPRPAGPGRPIVCLQRPELCSVRLGTGAALGALGARSPGSTLPQWVLLPGYGSGCVPLLGPESSLAGRKAGLSQRSVFWEDGNSCPKPSSSVLAPRKLTGTGRSEKLQEGNACLLTKAGAWRRQLQTRAGRFLWQPAVLRRQTV